MSEERKDNKVTEENTTENKENKVQDKESNTPEEVSNQKLRKGRIRKIITWVAIIVFILTAISRCADDVTSPNIKDYEYFVVALEDVNVDVENPNLVYFVKGFNGRSAVNKLLWDFYEENGQYPFIKLYEIDNPQHENALRKFIYSKNSIISPDEKFGEGVLVAVYIDKYYKNMYDVVEGMGLDDKGLYFVTIGTAYALWPDTMDLYQYWHKWKLND